VTLVTFNKSSFLPHNGFKVVLLTFSRRSRLFYRRFARALVFVAFAASWASARDLALVSNKSNGVQAITVADLVKVCKAQSKSWPDGKPVTFVMRAPSAPEMKLVLEKLFEMPENEVNGLIASSNHGRASHPAIVIAASDDDLVDKVASLPGAVGVVDVYSINSSVSVVKIGGKLPLEPGYLLHGN
jgi:hypothetical protein